MSEAGQNRIEFMETRGVGLVADVNIGVLDTIQNTHIERIKGEPGKNFSYEQGEREGLTQANIGFFYVSLQLARTVPYRGGNRHEFDRNYGITKDDRDTTEAIGLNESGFGDMTFPWQFGPALANAMVQTCVEENQITADQAAQLTLGDWANIIGSGWFACLAHSFAFAGQSVYRDIGGRLADFKKDALITSVCKNLGIPREDNKLFLPINEKLEPAEGILYLTATIDPDLKTKLRQTMRQSGNSIGCPGARKTALIDQEIANSDPHFNRLTELGHITMSAASRDKNHRVLVEQEFSAIDRTLVVIADQLRRYDHLYGTPTIATKRGIAKPPLKHTFLPPTNSMMRLYEPTPPIT